MTNKKTRIVTIEKLQLQKLASRFIAGESDALGELYERLHDHVFRTALRILKNEADAKDVTQDTFMRAWSSRQRLRDPSCVRAWFGRIAANLSKSHWRRAKRTDCLDDIELATYATPQDALEKAQSSQRLKQAIGRLTPRQCQVIRLRVEREMSYKEIAAELGCSSGSARVNYTYGVAGLREMVAI